MKHNRISAIEALLFHKKTPWFLIALESLFVTAITLFLFQYVPQQNPNGAIPQLHFSLFLFIVLGGKSITAIFKMGALLLHPRKRTVLSLLPCSYSDRVAVCRMHSGRLMKQTLLYTIVGILFGTTLVQFVVISDPYNVFLAVSLILAVFVIQFSFHLLIPRAVNFVSKVDKREQGIVYTNLSTVSFFQKFKMRVSEWCAKRIHNAKIALVVRHQIHSLFIEAKLPLFILFIVLPVVTLLIRFAIPEEFHRWNISILMGAFTLFLIATRTVLRQSKEKLVQFPFYRVSDKDVAKGNLVVSLMLFVPVFITLFVTLPFISVQIAILELAISLFSLIIVILVNRLSLSIKEGLEAALSMVLILEIILFNFIDAFTAGFIA